MPDVPETQEFGPVSVSLDEMEQQTKTPVPPKLDEIKVEGDDIPEEYRGKSVSEILKMTSGFANALKVSEQARQSAETMARMASQQATPAPVAPPPAAPKEMSREELAELYSTDPLKAIEILNEQAINRAATHLNERLAPLYGGVGSAVEAQVRQQFPDVFDSLGPEIEATIKEIGGRDRLTTQKSWQDLVSYVRGQPQNFKKMVDAAVATATKSAANGARAAQEQEVGFQAPPSRRVPSSTIGQMDPVKRQIAAELRMTDEQYLQWEKTS